MSEFVTVIGSVEFDPTERQVQGKDVRDITIRATHNQKKYRVTLWPNLEDVPVAKGDILCVSGKGTQNVVNGDNGATTYNNVSAFGAVVLGGLVMGEKPATDNANVSAQANAEDEIPF